jgi:putative PIN family toxin of toxin-antitoxin system
MIKIVLDTNVIISAAFSPSGNCARIINLLTGSEEIQLFYSESILAEYQLVLSREHLDISPLIQTAIIEAIKVEGKGLEPAASTVFLIDESDRIFYDTALEAGAILITGNRKHFPDVTFVMSPGEFLAFWNSRF